MENKTLAQLKRDIQVGKAVLCTGWWEEDFINFSQEGPRGPLVQMPVPVKMRPLRVVRSTCTANFTLSSLDDMEDKKPASYCEWPKASDLEYIGDKFTITCRDERGAWQKRVYQLFDN